MDRSSAVLGTASEPALYRGTVTALDGRNLEATLNDAAGTTLRLRAEFNIDASGTAVTGVVRARGR
jgi:hypothetical protein